MNNDKELVTQHDLLTIIEDFIGKSTGLSLVDRRLVVSLSGAVRKPEVVESQSVEAMKPA